MGRLQFSLVVAALVVATILASALPANAQSGNGWYVAYYPNLDWSGAPVAAQTVSSIAFNWNAGSPAPGIPAQNFTARMTTWAGFSSGVYRFSVQADDEVVFNIDGATVLDTRGRGLSGQTLYLDVAMTGGTHQLEVDYRQYTLGDYIYFNWTSLASAGPVTLPVTGGTPELPGSAASVVTPLGDYTRCIQQGLHQANCFVPNAENSPNLGSILMEPAIQVWGNCTADQVTTFLTGPYNVPEQFKCSKTQAGWFPD